MALDFNEFLRIMTSILIILLVVQGLDYVFGLGVNNYVFIVFCIVFAFTIGSIYHHILISRAMENQNEEELNERLQDKLEKEVEELNKELDNAEF